MDVVAVPAAEELAHGKSRRLAEDVPTRDVDSTFDIRVAFQRSVHHAVELYQLPRIRADHVGRELAQSGAHAIGIRGKVERTERADFAVPRQSVVGFDADDGAVEHLNALAAAP